jgi:hypothetical protein
VLVLSLRDFAFSVGLLESFGLRVYLGNCEAKGLRLLAWLMSFFASLLIFDL